MAKRIYTDEDVTRAKALHASGMRPVDIGRQIGIPPTSIYYVLGNKYRPRKTPVAPKTVRAGRHEWTQLTGWGMR